MTPQIPHILIVDDYPADNFIHKRLLLGAQIAETVSVCENGQQALDWLQQCPEAHRPELLLLDLNMPVMDGWDFLEAHALLPLAQQVQKLVIMLSTALPQAREAQLFGHKQVRGCLTKPLSMAGLGQLLT